MARTILPVTLAATLIGVACMKPNPLAALADDEVGDGDGDPGDGDPGDGDGDPGDGDPGDGDPGDGDPGDGDGDPGDGDGDPGDGDGDLPLPDLGDGQECPLIGAFEPTCVDCLASACCPAVALCSEAEACECLVACELAGGSAGACKNECGPKPEDVPEVAVLLACADASCPDEC